MGNYLILSLDKMVFKHFTKTSIRRNFIMDWKRKLTSRKLWMAIVAFVTPLLLAFGLAETEVSQIVAIIMAGADVVAYIIAEGMVDAGSK
jgi:hypothetical protein